MKCTVCTHPQLHDIDQALLAGDATFEALSGQYGPSRSAIYRHKRHLQKKMRQVEKRLENQVRLDTLLHYNHYLETTRQVERTALADGDTRQTLRAVREGTRILNFITKLEVQFEPETIYRILASPHYTTQDCLLPSDPGFIAATHQALAHNCFFPCPDIPIDSELEAWDHADAVAADQAKIFSPETPNSQLDTLLHRVFPSLAQSPTTPPLTANRPKNQREKSAKLPRKSRLSNYNNKQYQKDKISEKTTAQNPPLGRKTEPHPVNPPLETSQSELETSSPTLPPGITPEILVQILPRLDELPGEPLETENLAPIQRKMSAKLLRQSRLPKVISKLFHKDKVSEKTSAKNPPVGRESAAPPAINQAFASQAKLQARPTACRQPKTAPPEPAPREARIPLHSPAPQVDPTSPGLPILLRF